MLRKNGAETPTTCTALVAVGSRNPVKVTAVRLGFESFRPDAQWRVVGSDVTSGIPDQPMSDEEALRGATTRAQAAFASTGTVYGVGLEESLSIVSGRWYDSGWVVITDGRRFATACTLRMAVPDEIMRFIDSGDELSTVWDKLLNLHNSKQGTGHFGCMTDNLLTRERVFHDAVVAALADLAYTDKR